MSACGEKLAARATTCAAGACSIVCTAGFADCDASAASGETPGVVELAAQIQQLAKNAQTLAGSVDQTSASIQQMNNSLRQTASNGNDLLAAVDEASATVDDVKREAMLQKAMKMTIYDYGLIPLYSPKATWASNAKVTYVPSKANITSAIFAAPAGS